MASGVKVNPNVVETFNRIKLKKDIRYFTMTMNDSLTEVIVKDIGEKDATYQSFLDSLTEKDAVYAVFDFEYTFEEVGKRNKLLFITWVPQKCKLKHKMLFASTKAAVKSKLNGINLDFEANSKDTLDLEDITNKCVSISK